MRQCVAFNIQARASKVKVTLGGKSSWADRWVDLVWTITFIFIFKDFYTTYLLINVH